MDTSRCAEILRGAPILRGIGKLLLIAGAVLVWSCLTATPAQAQEAAPPDTACKLCHVDNEDEITLPSGETIQLGIDLAPLSESVHGAHAAESVYCTDCHASRDRYRFPHQPNPAVDRAEFEADIAQNCESCHTTIEAHNPGHLLAKDNPNLPGCTDCHGGHEVAPVASMAADPVGTCQGCHQTYADPVVQKTHEQIVANFSAEQTCQTCHSDVALTEDALCKTCHSLLDGEAVLPSGETLPLHVDPQMIVDSVHGDREIQGVAYSPLQCTDCHREIQEQGFPHDAVTAGSLREWKLEKADLCGACHTDIAEKQPHDIHFAKIAEGNLDAATCTDCHGYHAVQTPNEPRQRISETCGACHSAINDQYAHSVHGAALLGEDNPDVPVCIDCHGVHDIEDPLTTQFRLNSPQLCAECHADEELMAQYGISTDVFDTYVADFHGTTVMLFEQQSPDQPVNTAVCYDCHGVHNILPATEENSQIMKENLLVTCQQCHPDATANFSDAWTSHYQPSLEHNPLVYFVDLFYMIVIPVTLGGFALFIGTDVYRQVRERRGQRKRSRE